MALGFRKFISEVFVNGKFPKFLSSENFPLYGICHETILHATGSVLIFIIYACRTILGGIVTDILGHHKHTAFAAPYC